MKTPLLDRINRDRLSPMMKQYVEMKEAHPDCLLFFRLGDFYELFFDDALVASRVLEIALTGRDCGQTERAPMCGVPFHAVDAYLARLIGQGYKVAICEQMEDPSTTKGIVRRDITRIVTPGTITQGEQLVGERNNYLVSVWFLQGFYGLAYADITTYELAVTPLLLGDSRRQLIDELERLRPAELLCPQTFLETDLAQRLKKQGILLSPQPDSAYLRTDLPATLLPDHPHAALWEPALLALLHYIQETQRELPPFLQPARYVQQQAYLLLDANARRTLELTESMRGGGKKGSLLGYLDCTQTAMGSRALRHLVEQPLLDLTAIEARLDVLEELRERYILRQEVRDCLSGMQDLERLTTKILNGQANPRDLGNLRNTLSRVPSLLELTAALETPLVRETLAAIDSFESLTDLLQSALVDRPPLTVKDGGLIRPGYHEVCDNLRRAATEGKDWLLELEQNEKENTGIKTLKVGYNRVFGYYLEVTKSQQALVPTHWVRKQTLANAERYITEELKKLEETLLGAQQKLLQLEMALFQSLREEVVLHGETLLQAAQALARLDAWLALAEIADREQWVRPVLTTDHRLRIVGGRHPVVQAALPEGRFVPNDTELDGDSSTLILLTGPNMAGKSTYMRQIAQIVLLAQMGSFVPAQSAEIGRVDALFTRIGASDDLASGQSTFMVEMSEMATILQRATPDSLLLLDEIGRGTSTYDGLAIASAIIEEIAGDKGVGARTLFATHYHELVELESFNARIRNYHVQVRREGEEVVFLHQIARGGSDDSYGIEVAQLAGVPTPVVERAKQTLRLLEKNNAGQTRLKFRKLSDPMEGQLQLLPQEPKNNHLRAVLEKLKEVDIQRLSPLEALNALYQLQQEAKQALKSSD